MELINGYLKRMTELDEYMILFNGSEGASTEILPGIYSLQEAEEVENHFKEFGSLPWINHFAREKLERLAYHMCIVKIVKRTRFKKDVAIR